MTNSEKNASACILPFVELNIGTEGTAQPCCVINSLITSDDRIMSVYDDTIESIWNSSDLRSIRKRMHAGEKLPECQICYDQEAGNGASERTRHNTVWEDGHLSSSKATVDDVMCRAQETDYHVPTGPEHLLLKVNNVCNLRCRMCDGSSSSSIAQDPVQSSWMPSHVQPMRWRGSLMTIGPSVFAGVTQGGDLGDWAQSFHEEKTLSLDDAVVRRSAFLHSPLPPEASHIRVDLHSVDVNDTPFLTIHLDDLIVSEGLVEEGKNLLSLPIPEECALREHMTISFDTDHPIIIDQISFERASSTNQFSGKNITSGLAWHKDVSFIKNQLFSSSTNLTQVNVMGGEPTLVKDVRFILGELIATGKAHSMHLGVVTNATQCDDEWLELLGSFKAVIVALSVDGYRDINSYIRAGADWDAIEASIDRYKGLSNAYVYCHMTVQAYNMMHIIPFVEFCEAKWIGIRLYQLDDPRMLSILTMPRPARELAAAKISQYLIRNSGVAYTASQAGKRLMAKISRYFFPKSTARFRPSQAGTELMAIRDALNSAYERSDSKHLDRFKAFTAELDADRAQSFNSVNAELTSYL
jgi:MoaA/NifB/PqqE/SkfB family radical SAM enzyme